MTATKSSVLLLSAGRRVELAKAFRSRLAALLPGARLMATDLAPERSAACQVADVSFASPPVTEPGYADYLLDLCLSQGVGLVIPTIDTELLPLARVRDRFADHGVQVVISENALVEVCRDKRRTAELFAKIGVDTPQIFDREALSFPCFAKPYDGSRSVGARLVLSSSDTSIRPEGDERLMFMEYIDASHVEYTVDAYYDRRGELATFVPRERIEVRDGEVNKGVTRRDHVFDYLREPLSRISGARGCLTVQLFAKPDGSRYAALEINPRFGGGYPLSFAAGADFPGWLVREYLLDEPIQPFDGWEADLLMLRYDAHVLVHGHD